MTWGRPASSQVLYRFANIDLLCFNTLNRYFGCGPANYRWITPNCALLMAASAPGKC